MARRYYDTPQRVFQLFKNHPALSQMYSEFGVEIDGIKRVSEFLVLNHDKVETYKLQSIYKSRTSETLEADQENPVKDQVEEFVNLPQTGLEQGDIYYVQNPYPGKYYYWDGSEWKEDPESKDKSRIQYLETLYEEHGYKVWEDEYGYFIAVENDEGNIVWEEIGQTSADYTVIRKSQLPANPIAGDVYEVLGEDLIDIIASLYGFVGMGMVPPWNNYISSLQTNLQELLNTTVYLYRYGVTDNFYEKNIWEFIPEYDRETMQASPKIKLFMESIGRKLDQLEDKLTRLQDVYDIDEVPDDLLDHLGQMLGYEKEDFSLSNVSFRELLKNIIEIYKIKGTNYSFSFFFKFLGFNVNLKEFYFNRDVRNPEAFPGVDVENVEYYLTTTNPIYETHWGSPASHLEPIRSLNDWTLEYDALVANGCANPIEYMLGKEAYNGETRWHSNPWKYFKTNLIEYQLNPFFDKVNLTSSDNETIRKYIRFLSPTYLFTWINVNLLPWIEDVNIFENVEEYLTMEIEKTLGDMTADEFLDYENVEDYFQVWDDKQNKLVPYTHADEMIMSIVNNMNLGGDDQVGAYLRHDGVYIRQPGHPSHITNVFHDGATRLNFDNLGIMLKQDTAVDYDDYYTNYSDLPSVETEDTLAYVEETGLYYMYKDPAPYWELIEYSSELPSVPQDHIYPSYALLIQNISAITGDVYKVSDTNRYYRYHDEEPRWELAVDDDRYKKWLDYSYRPYPSYPINVKPSPGIKLNVNEINFTWDDIYEQQGYWVQVSKDVGFNNLIREEFIYDSKNYIENVLLENDNYFWRVRTKNKLSISEWSSEEMDLIEAKLLELHGTGFEVETNIKDYFTFDNNLYTIKNLSGSELDVLLGILSITGSKFSWNQWSSIYRFEVYSLPFPYDGQIIDDVDYQYVKQIRDEYSNELLGLSLDVKWTSQNNVEKYELIMARQFDMSDVIVSNELTANVFNIELSNGDYYWQYRIKKYNKDWEDWSNIMHFKIDV